MTLYEKSLNTIEYPTVLEMLAGEAVSEAAKERARALRPSDNAETVRKKLGETTAAKEQMVIKGSPSFSELRDVSASLSRAELGGMLNTSELMHIAGVLHTARAVQSYSAENKSGRTDIDHLFAALRPNKYLEEKITTSIVGEDEIADSASPELSNIRRKMRVAGDRVRQSLQKIISSPSYSKALQEPIITMRNDRYVVPVKAEFKSSVPGLVHDISSSGATLFIEPISAVQANNEIRELLAKEKNEIDRILMTLSAEAADCSGEIGRDFSTLVELDLIFAKAKLSFALNASEPELSGDGEIVLRHARHPLLPVKTAVPIDLRLGGDTDTMVITGPNTGGKTVTLKTIGLLSAMTASGLHIPVDYGSRIPVFRKVLADIGDEQSIEQSLSTFSSHMTNIVEILKECGDGTLLLFDELGAGTDPVEGAALAISIIEYARHVGSMIAATTHYAELKAYATTTPGVVNASCEFDVETLKPTYRLMVGIPGKSNAFAISSRLGIPQVIIEDAKSRVSTEDASFEEVIENLDRMRVSMEKERIEIDKMRIETEALLKKAEEDRQEAGEQREKAFKSARKEANELIDNARRTADNVISELNEMRKESAKNADWQRVNDARAKIRHDLNEAEAAANAHAPAPVEEGPTRDAKAGDTVTLISIGTQAEVISVAADGTLTLQAGVLKITAKQNEVRVVEGNKIKKQVKRAESSQTSTAGVSTATAPEIDVRGMTAMEAIPLVERYIDSAQRSKLNTVTVIHGKGTGALRAAIQQSLRSNKQVKSFRLGRFGEGEAGVTIVEIK